MGQAHPGEKTDYDRRLEVDYFFGFIIATAAASIVSGVISNLPVPIGVGVGAATYFAFSLRSRDLVENYNTTSGLPDNPVDPDGNVAPDRVWDVLAATTCFVAAIFMRTSRTHPRPRPRPRRPRTRAPRGDRR